MMWGWWSGSGSVWGFVLMLLFWGVAIWGFITVFRPAAIRMNHPSDRALEILRERYAKGEISEEEYEERRAVLQKQN